jgi:hypothetical protein
MTNHVIFTLMASLKNVRHEKFAQCVASGLSGADAYRQAAEYSGKQADGNAANWMNRPGVRERVNELKEANSRKATLSREQTIEFLCNVIKTSAAKVEEDSPLVQSAEFVDCKLVRVKIPDKIAAVKELTRMCGWAKPDRVEISATDTLTEFIQSIRKSGGHGQSGRLPHENVNGIRNWGNGRPWTITGSEAKVGGYTPRSRQNLPLSGGAGPFKPPSSAWVFRNAS